MVAADTVDAGEEFWVSGPRRDRNDRLFGRAPVVVDEDVASEYADWIAGRKAAIDRGMLHHRHDTGRVGAG